MNRIALLIGFGYDKSETEIPLEGHLSDLTQMYECISKNTDVVYCFTDNNDDKKLEEAIKNGVVSRYTNFKKTITNNLLKSIDDWVPSIKTKTKLTIYYSGHGCEKGIVEPDGNVVSYTDFINSIVEKCIDDTEIFFIIDACEAHLFPLPIVYNDFDVSPGPYWKNSMIAIVSKFDTSTFKKGSEFTKKITKDIKNILCSDLNFEKVFGYAVVKSSHYLEPFFWTWIVSDCDIKTDCLKSNLYLR